MFILAKIETSNGQFFIFYCLYFDLVALIQDSFPNNGRFNRTKIRILFEIIDKMQVETQKKNFHTQAQLIIVIF